VRAVQWVWQKGWQDLVVHLKILPRTLLPLRRLGLSGVIVYFIGALTERFYNIAGILFALALSLLEPYLSIEGLWDTNAAILSARVLIGRAHCQRDRGRCPVIVSLTVCPRSPRRVADISLTWASVMGVALAEGSAVRHRALLHSPVR